MPPAAPECGGVGVLFSVTLLFWRGLQKSFGRRWSPPARWKRLVRRATGRQRTGQGLSGAPEDSHALDKACAARWTPKSCWTRLFRRAGGLQRRGKVLSQTLEDKTGTQKRQSPVFFGRKSFSSQPLMGLSCVREFSERPHAAPLPHKRDEGVRNQFSGGNRCHPDGPAVRNSSLLHPESAHGQQCTSRQLGQSARDGRRSERFRP